jgi:hypothetical protein
MSEVDIRHLKLISCEEIICNVVSDNDGFCNFMIERPYTLIPKMNAENELTYSLEEWFGFGSAKVFTVPRESVICYCVVDEDVKNTYLGYAMEYGKHKSTLVSNSRTEYDALSNCPANDTVH